MGMKLLSKTAFLFFEGGGIEFELIRFKISVHVYQLHIFLLTTEIDVYFNHEIPMKN